MEMKIPTAQFAFFFNRQRLTSFFAFAPIWIIFVLGLWFVVLKGLGPYWKFVPGDLGDGRFNNYVLEHFFLWMTGKVPASSYWDAPFFFPYLRVTAFSDNLLGSAPIYAFFRWWGSDRETAFQWWYVCSFVLNYAAVAYVLSRFDFKPLAIGFGAFFFTFGIPLLAQGGHFQLYYRFGIPLASFFLIEFFRQPKLTRLAAAVFWLVWQFYLSIYLGLFLVMLLFALVFLLPFFEPGISIQMRIYQWFGKLKQGWLETELKQRILSLFVMGLAGICFFVLVLPYYKVSRDYGFSRDWPEITSMMPVLQSFLIADESALWGPISVLFGKGLDVRYEHQLFPGIAIAMLLVIGLVMRFKSKNSRTAWLFLGAFVLLAIITINFKGFSIYWLIWKIPGMNSIRALARIQMVWMWPLAFFTAWVIDEILQVKKQKIRWLLYGSVLLLTTLLVVESIFSLQRYYLKVDGISRVVNLEHRLPTQLPKDPILVVAYSKNKKFYVNEIDAMLAAQELGWPTLNGYSGNLPPGYAYAENCSDILSEIQAYMLKTPMKQKPRSELYEMTVKRIVPIGFHDCRPNWQEVP